MKHSSTLIKILTVIWLTFLTQSFGHSAQYLMWNGWLNKVVAEEDVKMYQKAGFHQICIRKSGCRTGEEKPASEPSKTSNDSDLWEHHTELNGSWASDWWVQWVHQAHSVKWEEHDHDHSHHSAEADRIVTTTQTDNRIIKLSTQTQKEIVEGTKIVPEYIVMHHTVSNSIDYDRNFEARSNGKSKSELDSYVYYHFQINKDGTDIQHRKLTERSRATRNNNRAIHIAFVGNFEVDKPTKEQLKRAREIILEIRSVFWELKVYEHGNLEGEATRCAWKNFDTSMLRAEYIENLYNPPKPKPVAKTSWGTYLGKWKVTSYYSPTTWRVPRGQNINCMGYCNQTASWLKMNQSHAYNVVACDPKWKFGTKFRFVWWWLDTVVTCRDRWSAIKWNVRFDIWTWIGPWSRSYKTYYPDVRLIE